MGTHNTPGEVTSRVVDILKERADALGYSYRTLSERSGVSKTKLQAVFTGERDLLLPDLDRIAEALGLVGWMVLREAVESSRSHSAAC